jgi:hypothetical protein
MRKLLAARPSPAMAVAFIALLAALSGTAIALPGTSSVDSGDVKNNSIRSKDVRNNNLRGKDVRNSSLGGADVKNDSLTGLDINESTLGQVPSANSANTANSANSATNANHANSVDGLGRSGPFKRGTSTASNNDPVTALVAATEVPILSTGPFDLYGKCAHDADNDVTYAGIFLRSRQDNSIGYFHAGNPFYLDDAPEAQRFVTVAAGANNSAGMTATAFGVPAAAPDGTSVIFFPAAAAKNGSPPTGNGIYGEGEDVCLFWGSVVG